LYSKNGRTITQYLNVTWVKLIEKMLYTFCIQLFVKKYLRIMHIYSTTRFFFINSTHDGKETTTREENIYSLNLRIMLRIFFLIFREINQELCSDHPSTFAYNAKKICDKWLKNLFHQAFVFQKKHPRKKQAHDFLKPSFDAKNFNLNYSGIFFIRVDY
jgi:hypothetical protein